MKVFVTCREEERPLRYLGGFEKIKLSATASADDITSYITSTIRLSIEVGDLTLRNSALEADIVSKLVAKAQGMYVW